jgi:hypothetical protein
MPAVIRTVRGDGKIVHFNRVEGSLAAPFHRPYRFRLRQAELKAIYRFITTDIFGRQSMINFKHQLRRQV